MLLATNNGNHDKAGGDKIARTKIRLAHSKKLLNRIAERLKGSGNQIERAKVLMRTSRIRTRKPR